MTHVLNRRIFMQYLCFMKWFSKWVTLWRPHGTESGVFLSFIQPGLRTEWAVGITVLDSLHRRSRRSPMKWDTSRTLHRTEWGDTTLIPNQKECRKVTEKIVKPSLIMEQFTLDGKKVYPSATTNSSCSCVYYYEHLTALPKQRLMRWFILKIPLDTCKIQMLEHSF